MDLPSTHVSLLFPNGDTAGPADWEAVHGRYREVVLAWCRRRGLEHSCAEDIAQEIWLKLVRELHRYDRAKGRFRSWLKAVVNNALVDFWRRQERQAERGGVGGTVFLQQLANLAGPAASAALSVELERRAGNAAAAVLSRVRSRLQESTWQSFYQTTIEKRSAPDVARELNISVSSVYKNTYRVKQMLSEEYSHAEHDRPGAPLSECSAPE